MGRRESINISSRRDEELNQNNLAKKNKVASRELLKNSTLRKLSTTRFQSKNNPRNNANDTKKRSLLFAIFRGLERVKEWACYSNFTETSLETPTSSIVTPYRARAVSIVRLLCVMTMN